MKYVVTLNGKNYEVEVTETDAIVTGITSESSHLFFKKSLYNFYVN